MKMKSAPADSQGRVGELQRRARDARKRAEVAKKEAQDAKRRAREARRLFKEAKKVAKKARNELAALTEKLKKLIDGEPGVKAAALTASAGSVANSRKPKRKSKTPASRPKQAKAQDSKSQDSKRKKKAKAATGSAIESQTAITPRRSRSSRKSVTNGSVEAVVDAAAAGEAPARTSEESVVSESQNAAEESVA